MAQVTVTFPPLINQPEAAMAGLLEDIRVETDVQLAEEVTDIQKSRLMPVHLGRLRRSMFATPARVTSGRVLAEITSVGTASRWSDVMERGRRPGVRGPSARHLVGWVRAKWSARVATLAGIIAGKRSPGTTYKRTPKEAAVWRLAHALAKSIHRKGIIGRGYLKDAEDSVALGVNAAVERALDTFAQRHSS